MSLLFRGAIIVDGSGQKPYKGDVLIKEGKITACGKINEYRAETVIDADGLYLSPGFVDLDSRADFLSSVLTDRRQEHYLKQGVTTVVAGQSGASLAPFFPGNVEVIRTWLKTDLNFDWNSCQEMFNRLKLTRLGVNFYTFAGQSNIRNAIISENESRDMTENELGSALHLAEDSLREGALGISFGPGYAYSPNYPPSETRAMLKKTWQADKVAAIDLSRLEEEARRKALLFFLREFRQTGKRGALFIKQISKDEVDWLERSRSLNEISASFNPNQAALITADTLLSDWARKGGVETRVVSAPFRKHFEGKTFTALGVNNRGGKARLNELLYGTKLTSLFATKREQGDYQTLKKKRVFLSAIANLAETENTFTDFIRWSFANEEKIEEAVKKITTAPAEAMGLNTRPLIASGQEGTIAVFNRDGEMRHVVVGGVLALTEGKITGQSGGIINRIKSIKKQ